MLNVYVLIPLVACLVSALSALSILLRDPSQPGNRVATALVGGAAYWALCQVLWTLAPDAEAAFRLHGIAAFGWGCAPRLEVSSRSCGRRSVRTPWRYTASRS